MCTDVERIIDYLSIKITANNKKNIKNAAKSTDAKNPFWSEPIPTDEQSKGALFEMETISKTLITCAGKS